MRRKEKCIGIFEGEAATRTTCEGMLELRLVERRMTCLQKAQKFAQKWLNSAPSPLKWQNKFCLNYNKLLQESKFILDFCL